MNLPLLQRLIQSTDPAVPPPKPQYSAVVVAIVYRFGGLLLEGKGAYNDGEMVEDEESNPSHSHRNGSDAFITIDDACSQA
jgi:hypothetical protein